MLNNKIQFDIASLKRTFLTPKKELPFFFVVSLLINTILCAILPGPGFGTINKKEIYQIVAVVDASETSIAAMDEKKLNDYVDWLKTINGIENNETKTPIDKNSQLMKSILILPKSELDKLQLEYQTKVQIPIIDTSTLKMPSESRILFSDIPNLSLDIASNLSPENENLIASEKKSVSEINPELPPLNKSTTTSPEIEGPVSTRIVLSKPPIPAPSITTSAVITLKFWVFPDGTVGKIIPLRKGNADLERIAMDYMKQWRFTPLPPNKVKQENQWGKITITFKIY